MKKLVVLSGALIIGALGFINLPASELGQNIETEACNYGRCGAIKRNGEQCRNCSQSGSYYCWSHRY